jgi:tetraacyldisaccharide 4'-kinase
MRAPDFWTRDSATARLLAPLGWAVAGAAAMRRAATRPARAERPVLCVGNLTVGGQGKTPTALAIAAALQDQGAAPCFLTRGYGGRLAGPLRVDPARHSAAEVGDEALLLAGTAPTILAHDRPAGAAEATRCGATHIIMDDGFQNPTLAKDLSLLVVDGGYGFGNGRLLPAGPLREPIASGLGRAEAVVLIGTDTSGVAALLPAGLPLLRARLVAREPDRWRGRRVLAFAGIGRPEKFFATLAECGAEIAARHTFADHHPYDAATLDRLLAEAGALGAVPVTTEKDLMRLPPARRDGFATLAVRLAWDDPACLSELIARAGQR